MAPVVGICAESPKFFAGDFLLNSIFISHTSGSREFFLGPLVLAYVDLSWDDLAIGSVKIVPGAFVISNIASNRAVIQKSLFQL